MLGADLREKFTKPLFKIGEFIAKSGIPPNYFTIFGLVLAGVAAYFISIHDFILGFVFIIVASAWDAIDGSVARAQKKATKFGNYLDALIDKYVEIIFYLGFALGGFAIEAFLVITGSLVLSYAKPRTAICVPIDNHDWPAIGERADRLLFLIAAMLLGIFLPELTIMGYTFSTISALLFILAAVVYIGSVQRMLYAKKIIDAGGTANMNLKHRRK